MSVSLIQTISVTNTATNILDFTNIPQTYTDLVIKMSIRTDIAGQIYDSVQVKFNGLNTNGTARWLQGNGSAGSSSNAAVIADIFGVGSTSTASVFANSELVVPSYTSASSKSVLVDSVSENNATLIYSRLVSGNWNSTAAINQVTLFLPNGSNFAIGSTASLYGVNKVAPTGSGATPTVEAFVVAGGGSAGFDWAAGGGAGGVQVTSSTAVTTGSPITVTIGAGGVGDTNVGSNGSNSSFGSSVIAIGGGKGGSLGAAGSAGGSGGGGNQQGNMPGGAAIPGTGGTFYGNAGGTGYRGGSALESSAGGGGAGAAGGNGNSVSLVGGGGGVGILTTISGSSVYYAGGGGGSGRGGGGQGGLGGGGNGGAAGGGGSNGAQSSGGGGGGDARSGGSGVVIIRYPDYYANPTATTGNPVVNYANGYKIYTWTNSGSITF